MESIFAESRMYLYRKTEYTKSVQTSVSKWSGTFTLSIFIANSDLLNDGKKAFAIILIIKYAHIKLEIIDKHFKGVDGT